MKYNNENFEQNWKNSERQLIHATITIEALEFLEQKAFTDFGMTKKGAIGLELTKLILIAKDCLEKQSNKK